VYLPRFPFLIFVSLSLLKQLAKGYVLRGQGQIRMKIEGDPASLTYLLTDSHIAYRFSESG
jgi:hypothetical protein